MAVTNYVWDTVFDSYLTEQDEAGNTQPVYINEPVPSVGSSRSAAVVQPATTTTMRRVQRAS